MSVIHRAVAKAEGEGRLTWTTIDKAGSAALKPPDPPKGAARPVPEVTRTVDVPRTNGARLNPLFVAATDPTSPAAEQYRLLRTRLAHRPMGARTQLLLITSPRPGEGKTTTCANLALTMAQEFQSRVVLVEADLRRPTLAGLFGVPSGPGVVDVLLGAASLDDALVAVPGQHLYLLPAGVPAVRSSELLASAQMHALAEVLRGRFDRIVVDTPPVTQADTHVLASLADGVLMVVRAGVTPRPAVEQALSGVDRERLVGVVLNEVADAPDAGYAGMQPRASGE
jgi:capsular exopolysaccharide synthesis family protein